MLNEGLIIISFISVATLILFSVSILQKKEKRVQDSILFTSNLVMCLYILNKISIYYGIIHVPFTVIVHFSFIHWYIGLTAFYCYMVISEGKRIPRLLLLVLVSWPTSVTIFFTLYYFSKPDFFLEQSSYPKFWYDLMATGLVYAIFLSIWLFRKWKARFEALKENFCDLMAIEIKWIRNFLAVSIVVAFITAMLLIMDKLGFITLEFILILKIISLFLMLFAIYLGYHGIRYYSVQQQGILTHFSEVCEVIEDSNKSTTGLERNTNIPDNTIKEVFNEIERLFKKEKIFQKRGLSISSISEEMGIPRYLISAAINRKTGKPYYDYVSKYRVDCFKRMLDDGESRKFTLLSLAYQCGFNSKASFNRIFKEQTGLTPSDYIKKITQTV